VTRLVAVAAVGILMLAACQRDEQAPVTPASEPSPQVVNPGTLGAPGGFLLAATGAVTT
jgi:hypothetical protein